jgi:hypothetical protein
MQNAQIKKDVAKFIGGQSAISLIGGESFKIGSHSVHFRYRTGPKSRSGRTFSYNVNPNTLRCDYEVWICGAPADYYLFPKRLMSDLYHDEDAYVDYRHPSIRVMEIDLETHALLFGRGGKRIDASSYFRKTLENVD